MSKINEVILEKISQNENLMRRLIDKRKDLLVDYAEKIARTGEDSEMCLKKGFLPVEVHFYQPIPDIEDLEKRKVWEKVSDLPGVKFTPQRYLKLIKKLGKKYSLECKWPNEPTKSPKDFYLNNNCFSYGCASSLHCIIREYKPRRIIEVGSGNSSKIIREAIKINKLENGIKVDYKIIDPYSSLNQKDFSPETTIIKEKVENVKLDVFKSLEENDMLFIDSSHVCKIGSDVNYEILEILPNLNKGVIIHFHDISLPYEYNKIYATNPAFRMFWTEAYLLQAFLAHNSNFEILLPMTYLQRENEEEYREAFPFSNKTQNFSSGSFWIRRIK
jgi:hypothetical protein